MLFEIDERITHKRSAEYGGGDLPVWFCDRLGNSGTSGEPQETVERHGRAVEGLCEKAEEIMGDENADAVPSDFDGLWHGGRLGLHEYFERVHRFKA